MRTHCLIALVALSVSLSAAESAPPVLGCWQRTEKPDEMMRFEATRYINRGSNYFEVYHAEYKEPGKVHLSSNKGNAELGFTLEKDTLTVTNGDNKEVYKRLATVPPELDLTPLKLGEKKTLAADKIAGVKSDLAKRIVEDQAVRTNKARQSDMGKVDKDNTDWLRTLIVDIGWIDATRFGRETATNAFLIVQHSGDLKMMQAVLPEVERDMKAGVGDPQDFALLYDRTKLYLGEKQRYGTQIGGNEKGENVLFPLEDKARVEEFRKQIGLFPLSKYLDMYKQMTGKPVKME